jgi:ParB-like chromosome segregation protein Spo0J
MTPAKETTSTMSSPTRTLLHTSQVLITTPKAFDPSTPGSDADLFADIQRRGLQVPPTVQQTSTPDTYTLVDGHRRMAVLALLHATATFFNVVPST